MRLSRLQQFILEKCYGNKNPVKADFYDFYSRNYLEKNKKTVQDVIHKSLESLVAKDLLAAFGKRTAHKWFIAKVKITGRGRKSIINIIKSRQRKLPIK